MTQTGMKQEKNFFKKPEQASSENPLGKLVSIAATLSPFSVQILFI